MRWVDTPSQEKKEVPGQMSSLGRSVEILSRLEPFLQQVLLSSPVFSPDEREKLVDDFRDFRERLVDGFTRENQLKESITLEKSDFKMTDSQLEVRLEGVRGDVLNFVSLGLSTIERLYLTNHLNEELYVMYKRVLRFLPQFHEELIKRINHGRGGSLRRY